MENRFNSWSWHDDRQWATSRLIKNGSKWFEQDASDEINWRLEVRSEDVIGSNFRMGELFIRQNKITGDMLLSMDIEDSCPGMK